MNYRDLRETIVGAAKGTAVGVSVLLLVWLVFYAPFVHYLEPHQVGIVRNRVTGELRLDTKATWYFTAPWVAVSRIDARPQRVCLTSASRAYNCRLVRFVPEKYREFVNTEGFRYYWWANRLSFNWGYADEYRGMRDLLRGYAYAAKQYPFVEILKEYD